MPAEAKDAKRVIFAEKYDEIFSDQLTAGSVLLAMELFSQLEKLKLQRKKQILSDLKSYENESFILHATYYIMYVLSELAEIKAIPKDYSNYSSIIAIYDEAVSLVRRSINVEKDSLEGYKENYSHRMFFKGNRPKLHLEDLLKEHRAKENDTGKPS